MSIRLYKIASLQDETLKECIFNKKELVSILYTQDGFSFAVYDEEKNKFIALEAQRINALNRNVIGTSFHQHLQIALRVEYENSIFTDLKQAKSVVTVAPNQFTWVPLTLFDEQQAKNFLQLNCGEIEGIVRYEINSAMAAVCVYSIYESVIHFFDSFLEHYEIHPLHNLLASHFFSIDKNSFEEQTVYCFVEASSFEIFVFQNKKLRFSNKFFYQSSRDFAFYLLSVYDKLGLSPDTVPLIFSGDIFKDAEIWQLLWKYVRNIRYLKGNDPFTYSYHLNDIPKHQYFHLFNAISCVLLEDCGKHED